MSLNVCVCVYDENQLESFDFPIIPILFHILREHYSLFCLNFTPPIHSTIESNLSY